MECNYVFLKSDGRMQMIEITNYRQGAVLNHNHGTETKKNLAVRVEGISSSGHPVKLNGVPAEMDGRRFSGTVELTSKINPVTASVMTPYGVFSQELTLVWDKKSFRRCNFYIDDHIFTFTDLAKQRPKRAFSHFYLAGLKKIHEKYGFKVTLNCFYHNDHHEFVLKDMPDVWKREFIDNSDWLKLSVHSYGEFPDRPYAEASAEDFGRDYDLIRNEIVRFAGEETFIPPIVIHWANVHPAVAREAIRRGMRCYSTAFRLRVMGGPSLADRQKGGNMKKVEKRSLSGEDRSAGTEGLEMHYGFGEEANYLKNHRVYFDPAIGIYFFGSSGCCCNLVPLKEISKRYADSFADAKLYGTEIFGGASHEQYTFSYYPNYLPDHMERMEEAVRCMVEDGGCKPVFFHDGLLGNTSWGD